MAPRDDESFAAMFEKSASARSGERRFHPGERIDVVIVAVAREAVFADIGGKQEGMFERIDLANDDGTLRVEVGSRVTGIVKEVDFATGQVRLVPVAVRRTEDDAPSAVVASSSANSGPLLVEGARVKGKITGIERYGVFVQIAGTQGRAGRGLVPSGETGTPRNADLKKHFSVGQDVEAKILRVEPESGRIRMSIGAIAGDDERREYEAFKSGETLSTPEPAAEGARPKKGAPKRAAAPEPRNFGTLGDILKPKTKKG